jgi:hypothetical protein
VLVARGENFFIIDVDSSAFRVAINRKVIGAS